MVLPFDKLRTPLSAGSWCSLDVHFSRSFIALPQPLSSSHTRHPSAPRGLYQLLPIGTHGEGAASGPRCCPAEGQSQPSSPYGQLTLTDRQADPCCRMLDRYLPVW